MDATLSTTEIMNAGMQCLKEKLGVVDAERFISVIIREQFDYTKWQEQYFSGISDVDFNDRATKYANENPHKGNAKVVL